MTQEDAKMRFEDDISSMIAAVGDLNRWIALGALANGFSRNRQMDMQNSVKHLSDLIDRAMAA